MEQKPDEAWFYSQGSSRNGPVSREELQEKINAEEVNPSKDMVWQKGMSDWKPIRDMKGTFTMPKDHMPEPPPIQPPPPTPLPPPRPPAPATGPAPSTHQTPGKPSPAHRPGPEKPWPGARRRGYLFVLLILPIAWTVLFPLVIGPLATLVGPDMIAMLSLVGGFVPLLFIIAYTLMRLSNLGMSRWWFFGQFIPILNLWVSFRCIACPAGYAEHKKLDGIGILLATLYWLLALAVAATLVTMAIASFLMFTDADFQKQVMESLSDRPELQQQVQEAIDQFQPAEPAQ